MSKPHKSNQKAPHRSSLQTGALVYVVIHGFMFWAIARSMAAEDTTLALLLFGLASLTSVVAGIAMWRWKRWGIYLYIVASMMLAGVVLFQTASLTMMFGAMLPAAVVIYLFRTALKHFT